MWTTPGADLGHVETGMVDFLKDLLENPRQSQGPTGGLAFLSWAHPNHHFIINHTQVKSEQVKFKIAFECFEI